MFDLLKKKISGFAEKILGNAETKPVAESKIETPSVSEAIPETTPVEETPVQEEAQPEIVTQEEITPEVSAEIEEEPVFVPEKETKPTPVVREGLPEIQQRNEREMKAKVGIFQKLGSMVTGTITLKEDMVNSFLEEFELSLLEADVELNTATALIDELRTRLSNKVISSREDPAHVILNEIKLALQDIIQVDEMDLDVEVQKHHPTIVLILGPNGAGKTTSIAKLAYRYTKMGKKVVLASADTFRAGSIEQLQIHADKIGVRMVKHQYGADPAAVAYDAVQAAKAENADIVLIDSAGRQDTNKNLLEELKKIQRVIQPNVKLYVGESYTGQAILTQAKTFDEAIGIDGFILTKLDTDTKGGGVISILHNLKKPIVFFGIGQGYEDLARFSMDEFLNRLIQTR